MCPRAKFRNNSLKIHKFFTINEEMEDPRSDYLVSDDAESNGSLRIFMSEWCRFFPFPNFLRRRRRMASTSLKQSFWVSDISSSALSEPESGAEGRVPTAAVTGGAGAGELQICTRGSTFCDLCFYFRKIGQICAIFSEKET